MPFVDLNGISTHYTEFGEGSPVVLLHGGMANAESWVNQIPPLVNAGLHVYAPERRGHGLTEDTEDPFSYNEMAYETIEFLETVVGEPADLIGWSDGAVVAVLTALLMPESVKKMILIDQYFNSGGKAPGGIVEMMQGWLKKPPDFLYDEDSELKMDMEKLQKFIYLWSWEPEIELARFAEITAPTLIIQGDRGEVTQEHSEEIVRELPHAQLRVLPGTHALPVEDPELVNSVILDFIG